MTAVPGTSFDRVASIYDATRGGTRRGDAFADAIAPWITGPRVVELGIGTGVIANVSNADNDTADEIAAAVDGLAVLRDQRLGHGELVASAPPGLRLVHDGFTPWDAFQQSPAEEIANIEGRIYSSLFDVDDAAWAAVVEPVLEQLRALPDPDRPRDRHNRHPLLVWNVD